MHPTPGTSTHITVDDPTLLLGLRAAMNARAGTLDAHPTLSAIGSKHARAGMALNCHWRITVASANREVRSGRIALQLDRSTDGGTHWEQVCIYPQQFPIGALKMKISKGMGFTSEEAAQVQDGRISLYIPNEGQFNTTALMLKRTPEELIASFNSEHHTVQTAIRAGVRFGRINCGYMEILGYQHVFGEERVNFLIGTDITFALTVNGIPVRSQTFPPKLRTPHMSQRRPGGGKNRDGSDGKQEFFPGQGQDDLVRVYIAQVASSKLPQVR